MEVVVLMVVEGLYWWWQFWCSFGSGDGGRAHGARRSEVGIVVLMVVLVGLKW